MNYDIWNSLSAVAGPNAPLDDTCAPLADRNGSAVSAVKAWKDAGMPNNQIVLGVPSYGHSFSVAPSAAFENGSTTTLAAFPVFNASNVPAGDAWSGGVGPNVCGIQQGFAGIYNFWGLIAEGFLNHDGSAEKDIVYTFDECSQTVSFPIPPPVFAIRPGYILTCLSNVVSPMCTMQALKLWYPSTTRSPSQLKATSSWRMN